MTVGREKDLFEWNFLLAKALDEVHHLAEIHVAVVIALNQQHGRLPGFNGSIVRRFERYAHGFGAVGRAAPLLRGSAPEDAARGPVMHAVEVHARGENIRIAREAHCGQEPAVGAAPQANFFRVHHRKRLEILCRGDNVLIFLRAAWPAFLALAESAAIHNSRAVVDREDDEAARSEVLIFGVGVVIVLHVMKAEHHLPARPAMHEEQGGTSRSASTRDEQLAVNRQPVLSRKNDLPGNNKLRGWKLSRKLRGGNHLAPRWR